VSAGAGRAFAPRRLPVIPGLGERVIYRELFPKGLTLLDLKQLGNVGLSHIAARQELREMIAGFGLPDESRDAGPARAPQWRLRCRSSSSSPSPGSAGPGGPASSKGYTYEDGVPRPCSCSASPAHHRPGPPGAALMAGSILWAAIAAKAAARRAPCRWRMRASCSASAPEASLTEIREAHRRLIVKVHPDAGGSGELANRVNVARDTLVAEMNRRTPRAS
jgi:hypothetical protein